MIYNKSFQEVLREEDINISVVIPCRFEDEKYLSSLLSQTSFLRADVSEIIIIANGCKDREFTFVDMYHGITVHYVSQPLMPGAARNYGLSLVKTNYIAFLDVKTIPPIDWISSSKKLIINSGNSSGMLGRVSYFAPTFSSKCFLLATYGLRPLFCIPGSVLHLQTFNTVGRFLPYTRAAEDVEWMKRASSMGYYLYNKDAPIHLYRINSSPRLLSVVSKWFRNYRASSSISSIYYVQKTLYFFFAALLALMVALVWNWQIADWNEASVLYIPFVFRGVLLFLVLSYVFVRGLLFPLRKGAILDPSFPLIALSVLSISFILDVVKLFAFASVYLIVPPSRE